MKSSLLVLTKILASSALAIPTINSRQASCPSSVVSYICYHGADFPQVSEWLDFSCLFNLHKPALLQFNSGPEVGSIWNAITSTAQSSGLDERLIFAVIMQETGLTGDARERLGDNGLAHGLMQAHGGSDCLDTAVGGCSPDRIALMIIDGVHGTSQTQGLLSCYLQYGQNIAETLRCYNSGSVVDPSDLTKGLGTSSYVSDVGNILRGSQPIWASKTDCGF